MTGANRSPNTTLCPRVCRWLSAALLCALAGGCGPVSYVGTVAVGAKDAVERARDASAKQYAPYEYWAAEEYLLMAREKGAYADYQLSARYGRRSINYADHAVKLAKRRSRSGKAAPRSEQSSP